MPQRGEHVTLKKDGAKPDPPFHDRPLDPCDEAKIRRLYSRGYDAYHIANLVRRRYALVQAVCDEKEVVVVDLGRILDDR